LALEQAFRDEWGRVLATLIGFLGDFDLAEEAAQEAFAFLTRPTRRGGVSIEGLGIAVDNRRNAGPGTHIPAHLSRDRRSHRCGVWRLHRATLPFSTRVSHRTWWPGP
jgi:hypothetical protein